MRRTMGIDSERKAAIALLSGHQPPMKALHTVPCPQVVGVVGHMLESAAKPPADPKTMFAVAKFVRGAARHNFNIGLFIVIICRGDLTNGGVIGAQLLNVLAERAVEMCLREHDAITCSPHRPTRMELQ